MIRIDGSYGEGGGQVIRTSVSLAAITGQAVEVVNVRARRSKPGLQPQHLAAVRAAATICAAKLEGSSIGSSRIVFEPQMPVTAGDYRFEIGTAGAAALLMQTILLPLTHATDASRAIVMGGTHVPHAPPADYLDAIYSRALDRFGVDATVTYDHAGFFPKGGGSIHGRIAAGSPKHPAKLTERVCPELPMAYIVTSNLPNHVSDRGEAAVAQFMKGIGRKIAIEKRNLPSPGPGAAVVIAIVCNDGLAGITSLGERGKPMERVAEIACREFMAWWKTGAAVDEHLADQLVLPAALATGESYWTTPTVTEHVRTVLHVVQQFVPIEYAIEPDGSVYRIRIASEGVQPTA